MRRALTIVPASLLAGPATAHGFGVPDLTAPNVGFAATIAFATCGAWAALASPPQRMAAAAFFCLGLLIGATLPGLAHSGAWMAAASVVLALAVFFRAPLAWPAPGLIMAIGFTTANSQISTDPALLVTAAAGLAAGATATTLLLDRPDGSRWVRAMGLALCAATLAQAVIGGQAA